MKIITNEAAYIQLNDIAYLNTSNMDIPASIYLKVFGEGTVIINNSNRYDFIKFDEPSEIEFFKNIDWMIEYNDVKDFNEEDYNNLGLSIVDEQSAIADSFNAMSDEEKEKHLDMLEKCELLKFKFFSLRDIALIREGILDIELPEGIDYPEGYKKSKGLKKIFKHKK